MIAPVAALVADHDLHPALVDVLAEAALEIHSQGDLFAEPREFPAAAHPQIPTIRGAREYLEHGPSFLQRRLPIWAASLVERSIIILIPLLTLVLPLTRVLPRVIDWHIRSRAFRWYRELRAIERDAAKLTPVDTADACRAPAPARPHGKQSAQHVHATVAERSALQSPPASRAGARAARASRVVATLVGGSWPGRRARPASALPCSPSTSPAARSSAPTGPRCSLRRPKPFALCSRPSDAGRVPSLFPRSERRLAANSPNFAGEFAYVWPRGWNNSPRRGALFQWTRPARTHRAG